MSSTIYDFNSTTTGTISNLVFIGAVGANKLQICRFVLLGYPCCFISSITDTTTSVNTYLLSTASPQPAIQKVFQVGFFIDSAKVLTNNLFCSLGLTATVTCTSTSCLTIQPTVFVTLAETGTVTVAISTTSFTNFGSKTFELTVIDTRNLEQTAGMFTTFTIAFTTCTLTVTTPNGVSYTIGTSLASQPIITAESNTCNYVVTCSLGSTAPAWTSIIGCTVSWSTADTTLALKSYTVPISINYASSPSAQTYSTSFTITLLQSMNVFKGSAVTLSPPPNPTPTPSQLESIWDGYFPPGVPTNSWGTCTGAASTTSITMTSSSAVIGRTILTTLSSDQTTGTTLSLSINGTTVLASAKITNFQYYTGTRFYASSVTLTMTTTNISSGSLCTPEILVVDSHQIWGVNGRSQWYQKYVYDMTLNKVTIYGLTAPEMTQTTWVQSSSCFSIIPGGVNFRFQEAMTPSSTNSVNMNQLVLLTGYYLVTGQQNTQTAINLSYDYPYIDFAAGTFKFSGRVKVATNIISSTIYDFNSTSTGTIASFIYIEAFGTQVIQICRIVQLGYPCCFIQSVTDTTTSINTYLISTASPQPAISKVFQVGFFIDSAKVLTNVLFCSLGLTATVTCTSCPIQPTVVITLAQTGQVTVVISTTSLTNFGSQTFKLTVIDSRNLEQTSGMETTFTISFTTCTLAVTPPINFFYSFGATAGSQTIITTESNTCNYVVTCTLGAAPAWTSISGCTVSWSTTDTTLTFKSYSVPISITYASSPSAQTFSTSFSLTLQPNLNVFQGSVVTLSPNPTLTPTTSQLQQMWNGAFASGAPANSWGTCTGAASTASITMTPSSAVTGRTILTTLSSDQTTGTTLSLSINGTTLLVSGQITNFQHYTWTRFYASSLTLTMTTTNGSSGKLCTPELLVTDAHQLWNVQAYSTKSFEKYTRTKSTNVVATTYSSAPEITQSTWVQGSSCFSVTPLSTGTIFVHAIRLENTLSGNMNKLALMTSLLLITGQQNEQPFLSLIYLAHTINFAAGTYNNTGGPSVQYSIGSINTLDFNSKTTGTITSWFYYVMDGTGVNLQICRLVPLGYPCCFIQSITDTTTSINTYLISTVSPQPAISKVFQVGFFIDSAKVLTNNLFCSLGLTAIVTCTSTSCATIQPTAVVTIYETGSITVQISATGFTNFGSKTFKLTVIDTRNQEQTSGMEKTFTIAFTTCTLTVTSPINIFYTIGATTGSQTIITTESNTCNYGVTCTLGAAPAWTSISGCSVSWYTIDKTLALQSYSVPITISYASSPSAQTYSKSFTITLQPNINVFNGSAVTLSPNPTITPTIAQLQSFWDGDLPYGVMTNSWGTCTGAASTTSITMTSSTAVIGRTILTTLSSDQTTGTTLSLSINGTTVLVSGQTKNFQFYTGTRFYASSVTLTMTATNGFLCTPELLVVDAHQLWNAQANRNRVFQKYTNNNGSISMLAKVLEEILSSNYWFSSAPEITSDTWAQDSNCFSLTPLGTGISFVEGVEPGSNNGNMKNLALLTSILLITGQQNTVTSITLIYQYPFINFSAGTFSYAGLQEHVAGDISSSNIFDFNSTTTGTIASFVYFTANGVGKNLQICRIVLLGYPCCFISLITDTTTSVNTYLISTASPQQAISKVFQVGFFIDSAKMLTNDFFCSLGLTATVTCTTCAVIQPATVITLAQTGTVTVWISTTSCTNYGNQTFQLTVSDTRNAEQTAGLLSNFFVSFMTDASLIVTQPGNVQYVLGTSASSQSITTTETLACQYVVSCSLGATAPSWVSVDTSGCIVSWSTSDTTLASKSYSVPITINYASLPLAQTYSTSFTITLQANLNVFKGSTVTLSPSPTLTPTIAQYQSFWDGVLPSGIVTNSWGVCTGAANTASITMTSSSTVIGRTILTTLSSDQTTGTSLSLFLNGTILLKSGQTTNFWYYTGSAFYANSVTLQMNTANSSPKSLCSPELLVVDSHPIWGINRLNSLSFLKQESAIGSTNTYIATFHSSKEITDSTWTLDTSCFSITLTSALNQFDAQMFTAPLSSGPTDQLVLLTGIYMIAGQQNLVTNIQLSYADVSINFSDKSYTYASTVTKASAIASSIIFDVNSTTTGQITNQLSVHFQAQVSTFQICRFIGLGYPCCFIESINDLTSSINSYFISETSPQPAITKVFQAGFYVDSEKVITNVLFCSLGLSATVTCTTCAFVQPTTAITFADDGSVSVQILTTSCTNYGNQTFQLKTLDSRNAEQITGFLSYFYVAFTKNSTLNVTQPKDVQYNLGTPGEFQNIITTESIVCDYVVNCTLDAATPAWISISGCTVSWYTTNTTFVGETQRVLIWINYVSDPLPQTYSTSFTIDVYCVTTNTFTEPTPVMYTINDPASYQILQANNTCGYSTAYQQGVPTISWVSVIGSTVIWSTTDISLTPGVYSVQLIATIFSKPLVNLTTSLLITLLPCKTQCSQTTSTSTPVATTQSSSQSRTQVATGIQYNSMMLIVSKQSSFPSAKIVDIGPTGLMNIHFNQQMRVPDDPLSIGNTTVFINDTDWPVLEFTVIPGVYSDIRRLGFNWTVVSFAPQLMQVKLNFKNPMEVSSHAQYYDRIQVKVHGFYLFVDQKGQIMMPEYKLDSKVLSQIGTQTQINTVKAIAQTATVVVTTAITANFMISLLLAGSLSQLLGAVKQLVIIVHVFLINLPYPMTSQLFFGVLMQIVTFQFFNFTDIYSKALHLDDNGNVSLNPQFNTMGYNALYIIQNFGTLCPTIFIVPLLWLSVVILYFCVSKARFGAVKDKYTNLMFCNNWIGFINETYIFLGVCSALNVVYYNRFDTSGNTFNTIISIFFCAVIVLFPAYIQIFYSCNYNLIEQRNELFFNKYGHVIEGLNFKRNGKIVLIQPVLSCLRGLVLICIVVFMQNYPLFSIFLVNYTSLLIITVTGLVSPYTDPVQNTMQIVNESLVLIVTYHLYCFTNYLPDVQMREKVGFSLMIVTILCIGINLGLPTLTKIGLGVNKLKLKFFQLKNQKDLQSRNEQRLVFQQKYGQLVVCHKQEVELGRISPMRWNYYLAQEWWLVSLLGRKDRKIYLQLFVAAKRRIELENQQAIAGVKMEPKCRKHSEKLPLPMSSTGVGPIYRLVRRVRETALDSNMDAFSRFQALDLLDSKPAQDDLVINQLLRTHSGDSLDLGLEVRQFNLQQHQDSPHENILVQDQAKIHRSNSTLSNQIVLEESKKIQLQQVRNVRQITNKEPVHSTTNEQKIDFQQTDNVSLPRIDLFELGDLESDRVESDHIDNTEMQIEQQIQEQPPIMQVKEEEINRSTIKFPSTFAAKAPFSTHESNMASTTSEKYQQDKKLNLPITPPQQDQNFVELQASESTSQNQLQISQNSSVEVAQQSELPKSNSFKQTKQDEHLFDVRELPALDLQLEESKTGASDQSMLSQVSDKNTGPKDEDLVAVKTKNKYRLLDFGSRLMSTLKSSLPSSVSSQNQRIQPDQANGVKNNETLRQDLQIVNLDFVADLEDQKSDQQQHGQSLEAILGNIKSSMMQKQPSTQGRNQIQNAYLQESNLMKPKHVRAKPQQIQELPDFHNQMLGQKRYERQKQKLLDDISEMLKK